jgi:DNA polymerase III sliding clamp (beta) subunit (PCNA family)
MVKVKLNTVALQTALSHVRRAIPGRPTNPVLMCVKFDCAAGVRLLATDCNYSIEYTMPTAQVLSPGAILIDAERLSTLAAATAAEELIVDAESDGITISTCGPSVDRFRFGWQDPLGFPDPKNDDYRPACEIDIDLFRWAVKTTAAYAAVADSRYALASVQIEIDDKFLRAVATNGKALCVVRQPVVSGPKNPQKLLIEGSITRKLAPLEGTNLTIESSENRVRITCGNAVIDAPQVVGRYPDYNQVLENAIGTETVRVNCADLLKKIREADLFRSDVYRHKFFFSPGRLEISIDAETSGCNVSLPVQCDFERKLILDIGLIAPFLKSCGEDEVTIKFKDIGAGTVRMVFLVNDGESLMCMQNMTREEREEREEKEAKGA